MKKLLSFIISICFLFGICICSVSAAGNGKLSLGSASAKQGDSVSIAVNLDNNPGLITMKFLIAYDSDLELTSVTDSGLLKGWTTPSPDISSPYTIRWADSLSTTNSTKTGKIVTLNFKIKGNASIGVKKISLNFQESRDANGGQNTFGDTSATITVICKNHSYGAWQNVNGNQHKRTCSVCGYVETVNHTWNSGTVTKQPTCKDTGVKTFTCTACNATKTETIAKTNNHTYGSWTTTKAATCTAVGMQERTCSVCGKKETKSITATGHSYGVWKVTKEATCTAGGTEIRTCSKCSATETRNTKALGHSFSSPSVTKQPTCTEPGIESGKCTRCGQTTTQEIKATGHKFGAWGVVKEATCTDKGTEERACSVCQQKETREIKALGHDFENPTVVKEATLSSTGLTEGKCKRCGETTQEVIPCQAKDESTGISVEADQGVFADGTTTNFTDKSTDESLKNALSDYGTKYTAYAVDFTKDGTAVKPSGEYKLILPNSAKLTAEDMFVYFVAEDGTVTEKAFTVNADGTISVKTAETGTYAVVDKSAGNSSGIDTNSGSDNSSLVPGSNEPGKKNNTLWIIIAVIAVVVIGGAVSAAVIIKKKNNG